jgi:hypothetical protein
MLGLVRSPPELKPLTFGGDRFKPAKSQREIEQFKNPRIFCETSYARLGLILLPSR